MDIEQAIETIYTGLVSEEWIVNTFSDKFF